MKKFFIILLAGIFLITGSYFFVGHETKKEENRVAEEDKTIADVTQKSSEPQANFQSETRPQDKKNSDSNITQKIEQPVPFVVQAPFANWKEPIFQNGCEEASMTMAMGWVNGIKTISVHDSEKQINDVVKWEDKNLGYNADTDLNDMQKIFQNYYHYQKIKIRKNITSEDIKAEIMEGNIVIVPTYGRALGNPNYTSPGPVTHMIVVIGHDPAAKKFITNDPGTKKGEKYQYSEKILFDAIWEYPSGPIIPDPPKGTLGKGVLVVEPKSA